MGENWIYRHKVVKGSHICVEYNIVALICIHIWVDYNIVVIIFLVCILAHLYMIGYVLSLYNRHGLYSGWSRFIQFKWFILWESVR